MNDRDAERQFLLDRLECRYQRRTPRCWGVSSDALVLYALGRGERPRVPGTARSLSDNGGGSWYGDEVGTFYPHDPDDLRACELTHDMAPPHLQERMGPVLDEFRGWVYHGRNRHGVEFWPNRYEEVMLDA